METLHTLLRRALNAWRRGDDLKAVRLMRRVVGRRPDESFFRAALGDLELGLDLFDAAIASYQGALDHGFPSEDDRARVLECLATALLSIERLKEAEGACREALSIAPTPERYLLLGGTLEGQGRLEDGAAAYELAVGLDDTHVESLYRLASTRMWVDPDRAVALLRRALRQAPDHAPALCALGLLLDGWHEWEEAERVLGRAQKIGGVEGLALVYLGHTLEHRGRSEEAEAMYRQAHAEFPEDPHPLFALGDLLRGRGHLGEARRVLEQALGVDSRNVDTHLRLGLVLKDLGAADLARVHLSEVLRLCPQHPRGGELREALDSLAWGTERVDP